MESELVSGFMTEHSAVIFVFFFLAEYASIVLICILTSLLFLGGYLYDYLPLFSYILELYQYFDFEGYLYYVSINKIFQAGLFGELNPLIEGLLNTLTLGTKSCIMIFTFI